MPFIAGIIWQMTARMNVSLIFLLSTAFICFAVLLYSFYLIMSDYRTRWVAGLSSNMALFTLGAILVAIANLRNQPAGEADTDIPEVTFFLCRVEEAPVRKSKTSAGSAMLIAVKDSLNHWSPLGKKALVYFKDDSLCNTLKYGDLFVMSGNLQTIAGPQNPYMFNYRQYLINRGIAYQVFIESGRWQGVGTHVRNSVKSTAERCREICLEIFREFKVEGQDFALVSALLLGRTEYLEKEVMQEFSHAGVIHVLSVSGLHVGIMYVVADKVFFFLKRHRKSRKLHQILILACIWAYAFVAGLPASVVRAALMFSLIAAGKMFKRSSESYNIVAVAALFQLLINPYDITQVGFQLSYVAVLGIFAFYQPFNELINPSNRIATGVWSILAVSMAAQLATFPLASYYFHMFPVYFLLTNLIVVPLAAVITYFAVVILAMGAAGLIFEWLAWPLKWSLRFMSGSVEYLQSWPGAVIEPIIYTPLQVIMIYTTIAGLFIFWVLAKRSGVFIIVGALLIFSLAAIWDHFEKLKTTEITVYQVPGYKAVDFVKKKQALFMCDSLLMHDQQKIDFQVKPNRIHKGIRDIDIIAPGDTQAFSLSGVWTNYPFIYFCGKRIVIIDNQWKNRQSREIVRCDIAVFSGNPNFNPENLKTQIRFRQVVIDSSVPVYRAEQLIQFFQKEDIPCHSVRHEGAFSFRW
jgi:competence protein ComEC